MRACYVSCTSIILYFVAYNLNNRAITIM